MTKGGRARDPLPWRSSPWSSSPAARRRRSRFSPYPIPLELSAAGGGLVGARHRRWRGAPFAVVVDTGTILTTFDDGRGTVRALTGDLHALRRRRLGQRHPAAER